MWSALCAVLLGSWWCTWVLVHGFWVRISGICRCAPRCCIGFVSYPQTTTILYYTPWRSIPSGRLPCVPWNGLFHLTTANLWCVGITYSTGYGKVDKGQQLLEVPHCLQATIVALVHFVDDSHRSPSCCHVLSKWKTCLSSRNGGTICHTNCITSGMLLGSETWYFQ